MYVYYRIDVGRHWGRVSILIVDFCSLFRLRITSGHVMCSKHVTKFSTPEKIYREKKGDKTVKRELNPICLPNKKYLHNVSTDVYVRQILNYFY